ncbi:MULTISPECIES: hypothetical protein [unclassified Pseudomonas]|uniref:hypothetical protein n=1 Tax=unclassified Pseudomonas TaxID=196821 RepID=UPI001C461CA6|nr:MULTISPECIES: hypothetical protein [unclassified Pseudomonas]
MPITDSAAIVEYLEELYPDTPMIGTDAISRSKIRSLERLGTDLVVRAQLWLWNVTPSFLLYALSPLADHWAVWHRTLVLTPITVSLIVFIVSPLITKHFDWFPRPRSAPAEG